MTRQAARPSESARTRPESAARPVDQPDEVSRREQFQTLILDHANSPLNFGKLADAHHTGFGENPICGDRYRVFLRVTDNRIETIRFIGSGCAISMASASMMTEIVDGLQVHETELLIDRVRQLLTGHSVEADDMWGDLMALAGVRDYPLRIKCASLPWHTLRAALRSATEAVTTG